MHAHHTVPKKHPVRSDLHRVSPLYLLEGFKALKCPVQITQFNILYCKLLRPQGGAGTGGSPFKHHSHKCAGQPQRSTPPCTSILPIAPASYGFLIDARNILTLSKTSGGSGSHTLDAIISNIFVSNDAYVTAAVGSSPCMQAGQRT